MGRTEVKRCKDLKKENQRLRKVVSDLGLDKNILKEALGFFRARGVSLASPLIACPPPALGY